MNLKQLGKKIESIRINKGLTMEEFGKLFNTSKGTVNNWEKGRNSPNKTNLKAIADLAGITVNELLGVERYDKQEIIDAIHDDDTMELIIKAKTIGEDEPEYIKKINEQALDNIINAIESSRIHFQNYEIISMYIDVCKGAKVYDLVTLCNYLIDLRDKRIRYMEMFKDTDFIAPMYASEISRLNGYIDSIKRQLESEK
ncbi:helix-turn-helix domain-containing protein [Falseniella ignava]|uniref:HTH cro/C1-type domain-containing protein n=1 Tax=Falseniella ignava CCUG 37419 TaxID=883112 RepID=K1MCM1_9LACT|nr:helix-turn-helix transcriptional regulator [Falseniella ignava]EKB53734.1 hypothetical protein HMPREF9707_01487 [Falseniella ignava CCUG 37419]